MPPFEREDFTISWRYIIERMESRFGIKPDDETKVPFGELETKFLGIWGEYVDAIVARRNK